MAPTNAPLLLPKLWRAARFAYEKAAKVIRNNLQEPSQLQLRLQPTYARIANRQSINRLAAIRQGRGRHYSSRTSAASGSSRVGTVRPSSRSSHVILAVRRLTSHAPFASTLRPSLTGGALGRTAGGYAIGAGRIGGARYFSHSPAAPAQVIQNVSVAMRGFVLSGKKARFDGVDPCTGEKRYKTVTVLQDQAERWMAAISRTAPGSYIDFQLSPTITAFTTLQERQHTCADTLNPDSLNSEGLMELLSIDLARALKDLAAILNDLKRLAMLGDLPISLHDKSIIRVRFPGCDADQVERLCDEVGVERGQIFQDEDFERHNGTDLALLFPFAPSVAGSPEMNLFAARHRSTLCELDWRNMYETRTQLSPHLSKGTDAEIDYDDIIVLGENPWKKSLSGYSSLNISELGDCAFFPSLSELDVPNSASEYEGIEGIYKFITECDRAEGNCFV